MSLSSDSIFQLHGRRKFAFQLSVDAPWIGMSLIGLVLICQVSLIWLHDPWADELQATALARASQSISDWYWNFRYEGHTPFWHLLLKIPLSFSDDVTALKLLQTSLVLLTSGLLYWRAPFTLSFKFFLSLNYFLFFEYGVIARDYTLTVSLFFLFIAFRHKPIAWLLIGLLALSGGLQSLILAGLCGLILLRLQGWRWGGVALASAGAILCLICLWPQPQAGVDHIYEQIFARPWSQRLWHSLPMLGTTLLPVDWSLKLTAWDNSPVSILVLCLCGLATFGYVFFVFRRSPFLMLMITLYIGVNLLVSIFLYSLDSRHFGLWIVLFIGCVWLKHEPQRILETRARALFIFLALAGAGAGVRQLMVPFSVGTQITQVIKDHDDLHTLIIPIPLRGAAEVHSHLRQKTYDITGQCLQSFIHWRFPIFLSYQWVAIDPVQRETHKYEIGLAELKKVAARAGGHALLLLSSSENEEGFVSLNDPDLKFLSRVKLGEAEDRQIRSLYRLDVTAVEKPMPIPLCDS